MDKSAWQQERIRVSIQIEWARAPPICVADLNLVLVITGDANHVGDFQTWIKASHRLFQKDKAFHKWQSQVNKRMGHGTWLVGHLDLQRRSLEEN